MSRARQSLPVLIASFLLPIVLVGCEQQMANSPAYHPLEASTFFKDGMSARPRVEGTVHRDEIRTDTFLHAGKVNGSLVDSFPFPVTEDLVKRGRERYNIYCSMCHGMGGNGDGMVVRRGFRKPPSYHTAALRAQKTGHFFDVMTNGFGAMPPYGKMIPVEDRWAIVAYIRALQLTQNATTAELAPEDRAKLPAGGTR